MAALLRARAKPILQLAPAQLSGAMLQRAQAAGGLLPRALAAGGLLPRAPAAGGLLPRAPAAGGLLASGSLRQRLFVRLMCGDSRQVFITASRVQVEMMAKAVEGKDVDMLLFEADMRRMALYSSWNETVIVGTRDRTVDFTSLRTTLLSMMEATMPGTMDLKFVRHFITYGGVILLMALLFPVKAPEVEEFLKWLTS